MNLNKNHTHDNLAKLIKEQPLEQRIDSARKGYFLKELINDESPLVRIEVIRYDSSYAKYYKKELADLEWNALYNALQKEANPDPDVLKIFLNIKSPSFVQYFDQYELNILNKTTKILKLKLNGLTKTLNPIDRTMTRSQLILTNNPLWTIGLKPYVIEAVINVYKELKKHNKEKHLEFILKETVASDGTFDYRKLNKIYQSIDIIDNGIYTLYSLSAHD